jgi:hypothetical protein
LRTVTVTLRRAGQLLEVCPAPRLLARLSSSRHTAVGDPERGYRIDKKIEPLFGLREGLGEDAVLVCQAGLEPVIRYLLAGAGVRVHEEGPTTREPPPAPNQAGLSRFDPLDHALLACARQHDRALVRYDPGQIRPARLIAQLARAWPDRTVAIAVSGISEARHLARDLQRYLPQANVLTSRNQAADPCQVTVATWARPPLEIGKSDDLVVLNGLEFPDLRAGGPGQGVGRPAFPVACGRSGRRR